MRRILFCLAAIIFSTSVASGATVFASLRGVVHDAQHRPIAGADVALKASESEFSLRTTTSAQGEFQLQQVPIGVYRITVSSPGFETASEPLTVVSGTNPVLHIPLAVSGSSSYIVVQASPSAPDTVTPTTLVTRQTIDETPGASRTLGKEMITNFVPGSYMTHDMLHIRGGHQTSWLLDGVAIPNTRISSNVGPQIDPKDIDTLETQRGSYGADVGDRIYGVFDVLPRNGFQFNREGEFMLYGGNFGSGAAQFALGNHSDRTAWYTSLTGNRSSYGLSTPAPQVLHDSTNSESVFLSLIRNQTERDQLRVTAQIRQDFFQIPYDPDPNDWQNSSQYYQSWGLRDSQKERDAFSIINWVHTFSPKAMVSVAPYYHFNFSNYDSQAIDRPAATTWHQSANYAGAQIDARADAGPNSFSAGFYSFFERENDLFGIQVNDGSAPSLPETHANAIAGIVEFYVSDHLRLGRYITLLGGERFSVYRAGLDEVAIYPRIGATVRIPVLNWALRGFYGHYFQPAPALTVSDAVLNYVGVSPSGQNAFTPLPSERDEEHQFGIQIPLHGWMIDADTFKNRVNNFLDHASLGESNMFFPIAIDGVLVRAWEITIRSPLLAHRGKLHLSYSNQIAEQRGQVTGGFTCSIAGDPVCSEGPEYKPLDHDQRNTLNSGFTANLPARIWLSGNVYYGSGFANGLADSGIGPYQNAYLPGHTTFDLSAGRTLGERWKISASALNVADRRVLLDNSITIGGFHWNNPRIISAELRYRFRF